MKILDVFTKHMIFMFMSEKNGPLLLFVTKLKLLKIVFLK